MKYCGAVTDRSYLTSQWFSKYLGNDKPRIYSDEVPMASEEYILRRLDLQPIPLGH